MSLGCCYRKRYLLLLACESGTINPTRGPNFFTRTRGKKAKLQPPSNFGTQRDTSMIPVSTPVFGVKDFNGVGPDFVRCTVLSEIKMADKKSEATEKQDAHTRKV